VPYPKLRERLVKDGQVLESNEPSRRREGAIDPRKLEGVVVDDADAKLTGQWVESTSLQPWIGTSYRHDGNAADGKATARFETRLPRAGRYEVRLGYPAQNNRASRVAVIVHHLSGERTVFVNQKLKSPIDGLFVSLGVFEFGADKPAAVVISNQGADGYVIVDAVQWLPK